MLCTCLTLAIFLLFLVSGSHTPVMLLLGLLCSDPSLCMVGNMIDVSSFGDITPALGFSFSLKQHFIVWSITIVGLEDYLDCLKVLAVMNKISRNTHVQVFV